MQFESYEEIHTNIDSILFPAVGDTAQEREREREREREKERERKRESDSK